MNTKCPKCGGKAVRDADTMDTFVCSSWYFLRYPDANNAEHAFDTDWINKMLPVDKYIGGAEHACMHLLYARFFTMALHDMGYLDFEEPFISLVHQGDILGPDGQRMSKSKGNVISPDEYIQKYGSDVFRTYLAFGFSYIEGGPWNEDGIKSVHRFLDRVERIVTELTKVTQTSDDGIKQILYTKNYTIKHVSADIENFQFNTAIARLMEYTNALSKYAGAKPDKETSIDAAKTLVLLIAPFAPHFAEELWRSFGGKTSIIDVTYPICDENALVLDIIEMPLQINGKVRARFRVSSDATKEDIEKLIMDTENLKACFEGKSVLKMIIVPGKIANIVVG